MKNVDCVETVCPVWRSREGNIFLEEQEWEETSGQIKFVHESYWTKKKTKFRDMFVKSEGDGFQSCICEVIILLLSLFKSKRDDVESGAVFEQ